MVWLLVRSPKIDTLDTDTGEETGGLPENLRKPRVFQQETVDGSEIPFPTTWNIFPTIVNNGICFIYFPYINWLAGFLNHQQDHLGAYFSGPRGLALWRVVLIFYIYFSRQETVGLWDDFHLMRKLGGTFCCVKLLRLDHANQRIINDKR